MVNEFEGFDSEVSFDGQEGGEEENESVHVERRGRPRRTAPPTAPAPTAPAPNTSPAPSSPQKAVQQARTPQESQVRYVPYEMPKRIGVLDRVIGKPIIEDEDVLKVILAQLADLKNDLEEIKSYYN